MRAFLEEGEEGGECEWISIEVEVVEVEDAGRLRKRRQSNADWTERRAGERGGAFDWAEGVGGEVGSGRIHSGRDRR